MVSACKGTAFSRNTQINPDFCANFEEENAKPIFSEFLNTNLTNYTNIVFEHAPWTIERILLLNTNCTNCTNFFGFSIFFRIFVLDYRNDKKR